jgi:outer membrane receptor protein involved in Fe transport
LGTPDLKWETTTQYAAAIESGFFNNRLRFNLEYYYKETTDLIRNKFLPTSSGFSQVLVNDGIIENQGVEFELGGEIIQKRDIGLSATLFFSATKIKLLI